MTTGQAPGKSPKAAKSVFVSTTVIRNSDDEASDSDSSLDDLDDLLAPRKPIPAPNEESLEQQQPRYPTRSHLIPSASRVRESSSPSALPVLPKYKYSLDSLVNHTKRDIASEAGVARAQDALGPGKGVLQPVDHASVEAWPLQDRHGRDGGGLVTSVLGPTTEEKEVQRIMHAMKRTEALKRTRVWSFFEQASTSPTPPRPRFPTDALPTAGWQAMLRGRSDQRSVKGLVAHIPQTLHSDSLLSSQDSSPRWLPGKLCRMRRLAGSSANVVTPPDRVDRVLTSIAVCYEPRRDLQSAYINTVQTQWARVPEPDDGDPHNCLPDCRHDRTARDQTHGILEPAVIDDLFRLLGGTPEAVDVQKSIETVPERPHGTSGRQVRRHD